MKNNILSSSNKVASKAPKKVELPKIILLIEFLDLSRICSREIEEEIVWSKKGMKIK